MSEPAMKGKSAVHAEARIDPEACQSAGRPPRAIVAAVGGSSALQDLTSIG
jgi:hypothetical protein